MRGGCLPASGELTPAGAPTAAASGRRRRRGGGGENGRTANPSTATLRRPRRFLTCDVQPRRALLRCTVDWRWVTMGASPPWRRWRARRRRLPSFDPWNSPSCPIASPRSRRHPARFAKLCTVVCCSPIQSELLPNTFVASSQLIGSYLLQRAPGPVAPYAPAQTPGVLLGVDESSLRDASRDPEMSALASPSLRVHHAVVVRH